MPINVDPILTEHANGIQIQLSDIFDQFLIKMAGFLIQFNLCYSLC